MRVLSSCRVTCEGMLTLTGAGERRKGFAARKGLAAEVAGKVAEPGPVWLLAATVAGDCSPPILAGNGAAAGFMPICWGRGPIPGAPSDSSKWVCLTAARQIWP